MAGSIPTPAGRTPHQATSRELWAPATWGHNHGLTVALQREFGLERLRPLVAARSFPPIGP
ncbi:MAG: hypothetical protein Q4F67_11530, partial [Propionibacteriaceae bacterium]|nr:hypothetical protein [Propionibacteriaceae bacterium]